MFNTFLAKQSPFRFFCISFSILIAVNARHLMDPPYWDAILGVYTQGDWLYRHGMNYALLFHQPTYAEGGPRLMVFDVFSTLFALLTYKMPPAAVFVVLHLLILGAAAMAVTVYFQILRSRLPASLAALWVFAAASNPIWSGQTASLYLEIPMTALLSASAYYFWKEQYAKASVWSLVAYWIKSAAFLHAFTLMIAGFGLIVFDFRRKAMPAVRQAALLLWPCALMMVLNHFIDVHLYIGGFHPHRLIAYVGRTVQHIPYLFPVLAIEVVILLGLLAEAISSKRPLLDQNSRWLFFLELFVLGFWGSFLLTRFALVRYTVMVQLPMACLLAFLLIDRPKASLAAAIAILVLNLFNQQGQMLFPLPSFMGRSGELLERSREYLKDLAADERLCGMLEKNAGNEPIVTKPPFIEMLRIPEFGYVHHPLPLVVAASNLAPEDVGSLGLPDLSSRLINGKSLCVFAPTIFELDGLSLRPKPTDTLLWVDQSLPTELVVYEHRWTDEELKH